MMLQHKLEWQGVSEQQGTSYITTLHRIYYYCICGGFSGKVFQHELAKIWPAYLAHLGEVREGRRKGLDQAASQGRSYADFTL